MQRNDALLNKKEQTKRHFESASFRTYVVITNYKFGATVTMQWHMKEKNALKNKEGIYFHFQFFEKNVLAKTIFPGRTNVMTLILWPIDVSEFWNTCNNGGHNSGSMIHTGKCNYRRISLSKLPEWNNKF